MPTSVTEELVEIGYAEYYSLEEKLTSLLQGNTLLLRGFEQGSKRDVLVRIKNPDNIALAYSQISFEPHLSQGKEETDRYWLVYNVGLNDLAKANACLFNQDTYDETNKFTVGDTIEYIASSEEKDSAFITKVYRDTVTGEYAYGLSREPDLVFYEEELNALS